MAYINCLNLNNIIDVSDNNYYINNINSQDNIIFGVFNTTSTKKYIIDNIPKNYPIGFYDNNSLNSISDISDLIIYDTSYVSPIIIYVSNGNDLSYNNGDFFRFYDESFNLINIKGISNDIIITTSNENFYFMRNMTYLFIATQDFSQNQPFCISGNLLSTYNINYNDVSLHKFNDSFIFKIPSESDNFSQNNKIFYANPNKINEISGNFNILVDTSNISYFYNKIQIEVPSTYSITPNINKLISFKSYVINNNIPIIYIDKISYSESCGYIISEISEFVSLLADDKIECLNYISKATLDISTNGIHFYEFNSNNHGLSISYQNRYDLTYGVYDGSYILFNIDPKYPITILNNNISQYIYIDETYNKTKIIHKSDNRISNFNYPYNSYNYYYGSLKIIVDNSNNAITNIPVKIQLFNLNTLNNYELSSNLIYTSYCIDPDDVNSKGNNTPIFSLYNKYNELFNQSFYTLSKNVYNLNLYELFVEPSPPYIATDRYNHDLSFLVTSNTPLTTNDINYNNNSFIITYNFTDYENNNTQLKRLVQIYRGPFIEIYNNDIFDNSNQYTNLININPSIFSENYNFFKDINVYLYDINKNIINLPFEIFLTGFHYSNNSTFSNKSKIFITGQNQNIINYNVVNNNTQPIYIKNNNSSYNFYYYLSKNIIFDYDPTQNFTVNEIGINIVDISSINIDNLSSQILNQLNILQVNGRTTESYNDFINFRSSSEKINTLTLDADTNLFKINNIDNNLSQIDISQTYFNFLLNTTLTIDNNNFKIKFIDINNSNNNLTIDGSFNNINFYNSNKYIDISNIGSYQLLIKPRGLSFNDFLFNDISNIINPTYLNLSYTRTININIIDNINPIISFYNSFIDNTYYTYNYPRHKTFNILNDIHFFNNFNNPIVGDDFIPLIKYNDNFKYDGDLQFSIIYNDSNTLINDLSINMQNNNIDGSAIIQYKATDLSGNLSNDISLTLFFRNIGLVELIGDNLKIHNIYEPYFDEGIKIVNSYDNSNVYIPSMSFINNINNISTEIEISNNLYPNFNDKYGIILETNIDVNDISLYYFNYKINKQFYNGSIYETVIYTADIQRTIIVTDNIKPFFYFPQLFTITKGYIDASNGLNNDSDYIAIQNNKIIHSETSQFNLDFSFTVFSSFSDLSSIINNFDISDNFTNINKNNNVIITLEIDGTEIPFDETSLQNINYLTTNNSLFKIVTIGSNKVNNLKFIYNVFDELLNSYTVERIVDIVDKSLPQIDFSFIPIHNDFSYVIFNNIDLKDFSYQAFDILKNETLFLNEIDSILFNFTLKDNFDISYDSYSISIVDGLYIDDNIKNINDISLNSFIKFSQINKTLDIIYNFFDNQYNTSTIIRKTQIISTINPNISFISSQPLIIDFGDINYNLKNNFIISHPRFFNLDINIDLSYILPPLYTTFSGEFIYDISALINPILTTTSYQNYDISFYSVVMQTNNDLSSDIVNVALEIRNNGPIFQNLQNLDTLIIGEAGVYISDASLIFGVLPISNYDKFYYYNFISNIDYTITIFDVSYSIDFNQNNPKVGIYNIEYNAKDKNNLQNKLVRTIQIVDTLPPSISFIDNFIIINENQTLTIPNATIIDIGSGIKTLKIDISNNFNSNIKNVLNINNINKNIYNFSSSILLLNVNDTSTNAVNYTVTYTATDYFNNSISDFIQIQIQLDTIYVLKNYMKIYNNHIEINNKFDICFNQLVNNQNNIPLSSNSIKYNALDKIITYEATSLEIFNNINFDMSATYNGQPISNDNNIIINNIIPNIIGNYEIFFQSFNPLNFDSKTEIINFIVKDTTPPKLSFITNSFFQDICNILLPQLSQHTLLTLDNNIQFFIDNNYDTTIFNKVNDIVIYSIPGININDIVNGSTITLSNELISTDFSDVFTLEISYNIANTNIYIDNSTMLLNLNNYIQNYKVYDDVGNQIDISRNIQVKRFLPFINLNYPRDANGNLFTKSYHQQYHVYKDLLGTIYDYYDGILTNNRVIIDTNINETFLGIQDVILKLEQDIFGENIYITRNVHVININCMEKYINDFTSLITNDINYKNGIFDGSYNIYVDISFYAFRIFGYDYDNNMFIDISNLISISGENIINYNNNNYYWGSVDISVNNDFNRANIEYLNNFNPIILEDTLIYTNLCDNKLILNDFDNIPISKTYIVDVSGYNIDVVNGIIKYQYFTMYNIDTPNNIIRQPILHLPIGKYRFIQSGYKNFYNKIKFSTTEDGIHNNGFEYTKNIKSYNLSGLYNSYTDILINATTPTPLYYYSDKYPYMGSKIDIKDNIIITNANLFISDNVLSVENNSVLVNSFGPDQLVNKIILAQKFDLLNLTNGKTQNNVNFVCITHQNINHNMGFDNKQNKLMFKKYQHTPVFDPVSTLGLSYPIPTYPSGPNDLSNNIKQDVTLNYLFDTSVNNTYSNLFLFNFKQDTSQNLITNIKTNILEYEYIVAVGNINNHIIFSSNEGNTWNTIDNSILSISALSVDFNGVRWIAVGEGTSTIAFSDNGYDWFNLKNSSSIFSIRANKVFWNNANSYWYILGEGINTIAYSDNGIIWNGLGNIFSIAGFGIHFDNNIFIAVGNGTDTIKYSYDGLIWNNVISSTSIFTIAYSVKWIPSIQLWIAVGEGPFTIATSIDGINWIGLPNSLSLFSIAAYDVETDGINIVIVGKGINTIISTNNLLIWKTYSNTIFQNSGNSISWSGNKWYVIGDGSNIIYTSVNGNDWIPILNSTNLIGVGKGIKAKYIKTKIYNNAENIKYELDIDDIYYNNYEINKYYDFFKNLRLLNTFIYPSSFLHKINEIYFENKVEIYNNYTLYNYSQNEFLNSSRIIFSSILQNLITFNLQTYIDISSININNDLYNYLKKYINNFYNNNNSNYIVDQNNLFFNEYVINILSDISGIVPDNFISKPQSIILSDGLIELNEYLLDSSYSYNIIDILYNSYIGIYGIDNYNTQVQNRIFLSIRDNFNNDIIFDGLTQQNIYHNMFIEDNHKFIFHKYDNSANTLFVNKNTSLNKTLHDISNNKKYLLEISNIDVYNCFVDINNIYQNGYLKNTTVNSNDTSYKSIISYFNIDELDISNQLIKYFKIKPITLNNISYDLYPYVYDISYQLLHTHSYLIDLNNYFKRIFYNNTQITVPYNIIDTKYIDYTIIDISYINDFNIYDVDTSINILYDKTKIELLNYIQMYIVTTNFKLNFFSSLIINSIIYKNNIYNYNLNDYQLINNITLQDIHSLYQTFNFITDNYIVSLNNDSINLLYSNNFFNTNQLINKYNKIMQYLQFHQNYDIINNFINPYSNINNFDNIEQMKNDINFINFSLDSIMQTLYFYYDQTTIFQIFNHINHTKIIKYDDYNTLIFLTEKYFYMRKTLERIIYEFDVRDLNNGLISSQTLINYSFIDIYNVSDFNTFINLLIQNYIVIDALLKQLITYSKIYIQTDFGLNIPDNRFTIIDNNVSFIDFSNQAIYVINNFEDFFLYSKTNYYFIDKMILFDKINYVMSGSKLLINSYKSNSIIIKFKLNYDSYLYPNAYLDNIVLDIAIPDITPPAIVFSQNTTITLEQTFSTLVDNSINTLIETLIADISYIDINQEFDNIVTNNVNVNYNDYNLIFNNSNSSLLVNDIYSLITIDIRNIYNPNNLLTDDIVQVEIYYYVRDNVNNLNIIPRTINVIQSLNYPIYFFNGLSLSAYLISIYPEKWSISFNPGSVITNDKLLQGVTAIDPQTNQNITVFVSFIPINTNIPGTYLNAITYTTTGINNNTTTVKRNIIINEFDISENVVEPIKTVCCYPPAFYLPVQHKYKLGSSATNVMRIAKVILNTK